MTPVLLGTVWTWKRPTGSYQTLPKLAAALNPKGSTGTRKMLDCFRSTCWTPPQPMRSTGN